ncbi:sugar phosphate isomerase/epimerase [Microbacterium sp. 18062]|uniref:sugar phosphate isomerase/epimerase family protein n=1 Tax=Microbacterium sp. 18062 TaxID=2681410 RepID=UPI00135BDC70|nr:sugar phosphate isomerase/epimerase family protein [Microbacterium sp. 18062]
MTLQAPLGGVRDDEGDWPIAAAMINFPGVRRDGSAVQDDPPERWADTIAEVARAGFDHLDPTDSWLRIADLDPSRLDEFVGVVADAGLRMVSLSTSRRSILDPAAGDEHLAYSHRVVDTAAALGLEVVNFGLMQPLTAAQQEALWFWTEPGPRDPDDPAVRARAVGGFRELGRHAESVGVLVSLEMYEDTYLGTADGAVRLIEEIDVPAVGLNPDLGNIVRLHRPIEHWRSMLDTVLPHTNYWHVKNYLRMEDPATGAVLTAPAPLELGVIDYRTAVREAIDAGFRGAFCAEHYGGDGLSVSAANRDYLRRVLPVRNRVQRERTGAAGPGEPR